MERSADSYDYLRDPAEIDRESVRRIRAATDLSALPDALHPLALRLVQATGRPEIAGALRWRDGAVERGRAALEAGAPILADDKTVAAGLARDRLPRGCDALCLIDAPGVAGAAARRAVPRAAAQVAYWTPWLDGAVVAIGHAPPALFALLEALQAGAPKPALVLGFPVGFVGAADSKQALFDAADALDLPFIALAGREGGGALAAAAVSGLLEVDPKEPEQPSA